MGNNSLPDKSEAKWKLFGKFPVTNIWHAHKKQQHFELPLLRCKPLNRFEAGGMISQLDHKVATTKMQKWKRKKKLLLDTVECRNI